MRRLTASVETTAVSFAPLRLCLLCMFFLIFYGRAQVERTKQQKQQHEMNNKNK